MISRHRERHGFHTAAYPVSGLRIAYHGDKQPGNPRHAIYKALQQPHHSPSGRAVTDACGHMYALAGVAVLPFPPMVFLNLRSSKTKDNAFQ